MNEETEARFAVLEKRVAELEIIVGEGRPSDTTRSGGGCTTEITVSSSAGNEHVRRLARDGAHRAIAEYHQAQEQIGFGETQRRFFAQKG